MSSKLKILTLEQKIKVIDKKESEYNDTNLSKWRVNTKRKVFIMLMRLQCFGVHCLGSQMYNNKYPLNLDVPV